MAFKVQGEIKGLPQLLQRLAGLKPKFVKKYVRAAMRKSASVVNKAAKQGIQHSITGQTKRSLGVKVKVYPSGVVLGIVEPRGGFKVSIPTRGGKPRYHDPVATAHLVEYGTRPHSLAKGSRLRATRKRPASQSGRLHPGAKAKPFLEPGFTQNEQRIMAIFGDKIDEALATL